MSISYTVHAMPAKPLSPEQLADADRLKTLFLEWQEARKSKGESVSQEAVTALLDFNQSSISQYINGRIPLNLKVACKFAEMLGRPIEAFSRALADEAVRTASRYVSLALTPIVVATGGAMDLACETSGEIGLLAAYRLADKLGDDTTLDAYDSITDAFLSRLAAERKKL